MKKLPFLKTKFQIFDKNLIVNYYLSPRYIKDLDLESRAY